MLAPLHGEARLHRVVVSGLLLKTDAAFQGLKTANADGWKILELHGVDEGLGEAERSEIEPGGERLLLLLSICVADAGVKDGAGRNQISVVDGDALIWTVHYVSARRRDSGKVVVEIEERIAGV